MVDNRINYHLPQNTESQYDVALRRALTDALRDVTRRFSTLGTFWSQDASGRLISERSSVVIGPGPYTYGDIAGWTTFSLNSPIGGTGSLLRLHYGGVVGVQLATSGTESYLDTLDNKPLILRNGNGNPIARFEYDTVRMRIGRSAGAGTDNVGFLMNGTAGYFTFGTATANNAGLYYHCDFRRADGTSDGNIASSGGVTSYNTTSDRRKKQNIKPAKPALDKLDSFRVSEFDMVEGAHVEYGLIAQSVDRIMSGVVRRGGPGDAEYDDGKGEFVPAGCSPWSMDNTLLVPYLIKVCQELKENNRILSIQVAELRDKLSTLTSEE